MTTSVRRRRTPLTLFLLVALISAMLALPAAATHVEPVFVEGNVTCGAPGSQPGANISPYELKVEPITTGTFTRTFNQGTDDEFTATVTITSVSGNVLDFADASPNVLGVVMKGGPNANLYDYRPGGVTADTGLVAPQGFSHVSFCFDDPPPPPLGALAIEKTAAATFDRAHDWSIAKTVDPTSILLAPGDAPVTATWDVVVTYLGATESNHAVSGVITVSNVGDLDADIATLTDLGEDVTDCTLDGAPFAIPGTLEVGDEIDCNYSVALASSTDGTNSATVTGAYSDGEPFSETATAPYVFGAPETDAHATATIDDDSPFATPMGPLSASDYDAGDTIPFQYSQEFAYDGDACGVTQYPNLARVLGDGSVVLDSATANVTVTIECPVFVGETVTGAGQPWSAIGSGKNRTNTWFEYTDDTENTHDLIQGRKRDVVGSVTITEAGGTATLCFSLDAPWTLDPDASGNVKIEPLDDTPDAYLPPGQYSYHFTEPSDPGETGSSFCVDVPAGSYGYAIHLDAGFWES